MRPGLLIATLVAIATIALTYSPAASCKAGSRVVRASVEAPPHPVGDSCTARATAPKTDDTSRSDGPASTLRAIARAGSTVARAVVTAGVSVALTLARAALRTVVQGA